MNPLIAKSLILLALTLPVVAQAAEETDAAASAAAPSIDMAKLYELERTSAGNLPLDSQLRQLLPADTVVLTMEVGEQRFHALRQEADREEPLGALLLVPDPYIGNVWLEQVAALRFDLAQKGWLTLAVEPPKPDQESLPERTLPVLQPIKIGSGAAPSETPADSGNQPPPQTESESEPQTTPQAPFAERFSERMGLALEQLRADPLEPLIVISFGRATPWTIDYLAGQADLDLSLVMIDPMPDASPEAPVFANLWASLGETRIVDLYHSPLPGYPQAAPDARIRKQQARREGLPHYLQARVAAPFTGWHKEMPWLSAKVRGLIQAGILDPVAEEELAAKTSTPEPRQSPPGSMPAN